MLPRKLRSALALGAWAGLAAVPTARPADGFTAKSAPSVTAAQVRAMECRYFIELLGISSPTALARQLDPIAGTEVDTVVCCASSWRFYNFPSAVDLTWRNPDRHPRNVSLFPNWRKMVDNLQAGGDPLRDAVAATHRLQKNFVVSFRMNDSHYVYEEQFPTHNDFWRDHPEFRLGQAPKGVPLSDTSRVLDYLRPEVRDFYFAVLEEICTRYEIDGVELDLQRAPRFFHDADLEPGRAVLTAHVGRIRRMLDHVGAQRGKHLTLSVRALHTVDATLRIGADVLAWDAAGWLDGIVVSPSYVHTADVGIEDFATRRTKARIYGELNFVHLQLAGTGHDAQDRRFVTPETYRAATLAYLERGADGVSFFNTYCVPQPALGRLTSGLLTRFKDLDALQRADKNYTSYATTSTVFGRIFPARNERTFEMFVADEIPGRCRRAVLRLETKAPGTTLRLEARINGAALAAHAADNVELFPPLTTNRATPRRENVRFFTVPLSALKFGRNTIEVHNLDARAQPCDFTSAELALYLER